MGLFELIKGGVRKVFETVGLNETGVEDSQLSQDLELMDSYYTAMCFGSRISNYRNPKKPTKLEIVQKCLKSFGYVFTRGLGIFKGSYLVLTLSGFFHSVHGDLDVFTIIEAYLWLFVTFFYFSSDLILRSQEFLQIKRNLFRICNSIWNRVRNSVQSAGLERLGLVDMQNRLFYFFLHSSGLDYFQVTNIFVDFAGTMRSKVNVYSITPISWQSPGLEKLAWFLESSSVGALFFIFSMLSTLPGLFAYLIQKSLNGLTFAVQYGNRNLYSIEEILSDYEKLQFSVKKLNERMSTFLLLFHLILGTQQLAQTYILFQLIRAGYGFSDVRLLLLDMLYTCSRLCHSFYSMSMVEGASKEFIESVKVHVATSGFQKKPLHRKKLIRLLQNRLQLIAMEIGPCKCHKDLPLTAGDIYIGYYITGALWP